jgi:hypothetical protein
VVVVVVGARLRLDSGRRLPWDPGEGVAQRLSGSDVTLSIVNLVQCMAAGMRVQWMDSRYLVHPSHLPCSISS